MSDLLTQLAMGAGAALTSVGALYGLVIAPAARKRKQIENKKHADEVERYRQLLAREKERADAAETKIGAENLRRTSDAKATIVP